jgi:hypothetical protein
MTHARSTANLTFLATTLALIGCDAELPPVEDGLHVTTNDARRLEATFGAGEVGLRVRVELGQADVHSTIRDREGRILTELRLPARDEAVGADVQADLEAAVAATRARIAAIAASPSRAEALLAAYVSAVDALMGELSAGTGYPVARLQLNAHVPVLLNAIVAERPDFAGSAGYIAALRSVFVPVDAERWRQALGQLMPEHIAYDIPCGECFGACGPGCDWCIGGSPWLCVYDIICLAHDAYCCEGGTLLCPSQ